jgi:hypothetical protein
LVNCSVIEEGTILPTVMKRTSLRKQVLNGYI